MCVLLFPWTYFLICRAQKEKKKKELGTFLSLGKEKIISCDKITEHDKTVVIEILCKVCAKCKGQLLDDPDIEGAV